MNWVKELCELYDKNKDIAGEVKQGRFEESLILLPLYHTTVKAQVTITIDGEGNFIRADLVDEADGLTMIPVTEKSASRTAGVEAHPLCDNLKYVAADYMDYVITEKDKDYSANYDSYIKGLEDWALSDYSHEKVKAIWKYIKKEETMSDLIEAGILSVDEKGKVAANEKINKINQSDVLVRFRIQNNWDSGQSLLTGTSGVTPSECWLDRTLQNAYIEYCNSTMQQCDLSYLTGKRVPVTYLHPKKIRNEGDGAKLISANDETNYTYRGRFANKEEAFSIGYEDSQKAHNALKWILRRQGRNWNGITLVTWESNLQELPDWCRDSDAVCDAYEAEPFWEEDEVCDKPAEAETGIVNAVSFQRAIAGYGKKLETDSNMFLMAFDAATTGRLAIMEAQMQSSSRYLENLQRWYEACGWLQIKYKNKEKHEYYGMVGIKDIADILYGTESQGNLTLKGSNEKMYAEVCKRLIACILQHRRIPVDMVHLAVKRASSPVSYDNPINWKKTLALACSFIKKQSIEREDKEAWTVALNKNNCDRSYLYGRLLAVADSVEYLSMNRDEKRETNAKRYMTAFSQQPFRTWKVIEERLNPYQSRLTEGQRIFYTHLIEEIFWLFETGDFEKNESLSGAYLMGFHNQAYALRKKEEVKDERTEGKN